MGKRIDNIERFWTARGSIQTAILTLNSAKSDLRECYGMALRRRNADIIGSIDEALEYLRDCEKETFNAAQKASRR